MLKSTTLLVHFFVWKLEVNHPFNHKIKPGSVAIKSECIEFIHSRVNIKAKLRV